MISSSNDCSLVMTESSATAESVAPHERVLEERSCTAMLRENVCQVSQVCIMVRLQ